MGDNKVVFNGIEFDINAFNRCPRTPEYRKNEAMINECIRQLVDDVPTGQWETLKEIQQYIEMESNHITPKEETLQKTVKPTTEIHDDRPVEKEVMDNWVRYVFMAIAYFIVFYVGYLVILFSDTIYTTIGAMAIGATLVKYIENREKNN